LTFAREALDAQASPPPPVWPTRHGWLSFPETADEWEAVSARAHEVPQHAKLVERLVRDAPTPHLPALAEALRALSPNNPPPPGGWPLGAQGGGINILIRLRQARQLRLALGDLVGRIYAHVAASRLRGRTVGAWWPVSLEILDAHPEITTPAE